jgi:uncharacterized Zn-binding protein involved in type VI secretion
LKDWFAAMRIAAAMFVVFLPIGGHAQTSTVVTGETSVTVEGGQASGAGDATTSGKVIAVGSTNVFIGGKAAATVGDKTDCGGVVVSGSSSVFVNGKPLVTSGSAISDCTD